MHAVAVLDRYLEALRMPGAQAITFKSNGPVEITINNAARAVNNAVTTDEQLKQLLAEAIGGDFKTQAANAVKDYHYASPRGAVRVQVTLQTGVLMARAMPWTGDTPAATPMASAPAAATAAVAPSAAAQAAAAAAAATMRPSPAPAP